MLTREFIFFTQHLGRVHLLRYKARKMGVGQKRYRSWRFVVLPSQG